nr:MULTISPECIES: palindromic element RPE5 domain-containing protein [spotted fever group]
MNLNSYFILSFSNYTSSRYTKINLEKSKESVSQGAERIVICERTRSYKDEIVNFSSTILVYK